MKILERIERISTIRFSFFHPFINIKFFFLCRWV